MRGSARDDAKMRGALASRLLEPRRGERQGRASQSVKDR
jgi:hypothetical protein